jgi:hypothetical protein
LSKYIAIHDRVNNMPLKDETMLAIGMISLALGILIGRFVHFEYSGFSISDFIEGILVGLSLVMNLAYLIRVRSKMRARGQA